MQIKAKDFIRIDFLAAVTMLAWAITAQYVPALNNLMSYEFAFGSLLPTLTRWQVEIRKDKD